MDASTAVAILVGLATVAFVGGVLLLTVRLYREGGDRQQRLMRGAIAAAFVISASQAAGGDGGWAASFPLLFAGWVVLICGGVLMVQGIQRRRRPTP